LLTVVGVGVEEVEAAEAVTVVVGSEAEDLAAAVECTWEVVVAEWAECTSAAAE
jgi:hypothetical protein